MNLPGFCDPAPEGAAARDALAAYLDFLRERNGDPERFTRREARMAERFDGPLAPARTRIDPARFNRNYAAFRERDVPAEELALLAFVKINAGEAYGVEVLRRARGDRLGGPDLAARVEAVLLREEDYHTRLLVGAVRHFEGLEVTGAWRPTWPLRLLVGALSHLPGPLFHPVLLGAEIAGLYTFHWLLLRLGDLFPGDPEVRASMEERLLEILVDEVGHVAYNRLVLGPRGRATCRAVAHAVVQSHRVMSPELQALGFDDAAMRGVGRFDVRDLPGEVLARAFYA